MFVLQIVTILTLEVALFGAKWVARQRTHSLSFSCPWTLHLLTRGGRCPIWSYAGLRTRSLSLSNMLQPIHPGEYLAIYPLVYFCLCPSSLQRALALGYVALRRKSPLGIGQHCLIGLPKIPAWVERKSCQCVWSISR